MSDKTWPACVAALALGGSVAFACGAEDTEGLTGQPACFGAKCDDADDKPAEAGKRGDEHRQAIDACEAAADRFRDRTPPERFDARASLERERGACLRRANTKILPVLDEMVRGRQDRLAGMIDDGVQEYRSASDAVCRTLVESSEVALEKSRVAPETGCVAQSELDLARLIGAFAALGVEPERLVDARVRYPDCWQEFDEEVGAAGAAAQTLETTESLMACMQLDNEGARVELVGKLQMKFPGRDAEALDDDSERLFRMRDHAIEDVCHVLSNAGFSVVPAEIEVASMRCRVHGVSMMGQLGDMVVPGVWPEGSEADT